MNKREVTKIAKKNFTKNSYSLKYETKNSKAVQIK